MVLILKGAELNDDHANVHFKRTVNNTVFKSALKEWHSGQNAALHIKLFLN